MMMLADVHLRNCMSLAHEYLRQIHLLSGAKYPQQGMSHPALHCSPMVREIAPASARWHGQGFSTPNRFSSPLPRLGKMPGTDYDQRVEPQSRMSSVHLAA